MKTVEMGEYGPAKKADAVTLSTPMGRLIEKMHGYGGRKYLDVSKWDTGIYFVRINQAAVRKLVITR